MITVLRWFINHLCLLILPLKVTAQPLKASKALCLQWMAFHASHLHFVQVSGLHQFCDAIASTLKRHKRRFARSANHLSLLVESGACYIGEKPCICLSSQLDLSFAHDDPA